MPSRSLVACLALAALNVAACGSTGAPTSTVSGTLGGKPVTVASGLALVAQSKLGIFLDEANLACAPDLTVAANKAFLGFALNQAIPATYTITGALSPTGATEGVATASRLSTTRCADLMGGPGFIGNAGTVTITRVDATKVEGTFDVTFAPASGTDDRLTGSFSVPRCDTSGRITACK